MPNEKPADWLESFATKTFPGSSASPDVATVTKEADKDALLFGGKKPGDPEDGDDTFIWDETDEVVKKYGQGMWRTDVVVGEGANAKTYRYWGKTRTEVTKALIKAQQNAVPLIEEQKRKLTELSAAPPSNGSRPALNLSPDTKLPFDPIPRRAPRQLTQQEILQLQEMEQTDPVQAQRIKFEAATGMTLDAFGMAIDRINSSDARRIADEAAVQFQTEHVDDWDPTPGNTALIDAYLKERKWPVTKNNLEIAFHDLVSQRRLTMPKPEPEEITPPAVPVAAALVEEVSPPPPPTPIPTGGAPRQGQKTEADLVREAAVGIREMPLDEARASLVDAFRRQRGTR